MFPQNSSVLTRTGIYSYAFIKIPQALWILLKPLAIACVFLSHTCQHMWINHVLSGGFCEKTVALTNLFLLPSSFFRLIKIDESALQWRKRGGIMSALTPPHHHHHCEPCVFEDAANMAATVAKRTEERGKRGEGARIAYREMDEAWYIERTRPPVKLCRRFLMAHGLNFDLRARWKLS